MPIITKPVSIQKNVPASFSLDKSALAAVPSVVADSYFSDSSNWSKVLLFYKSSVGNQKEVIKFDATQPSPTADFLASEKARDIFQIQKIIITDFDNGNFEVPRTQLTVADFDVDMSGTPSTTNILWVFESTSYMAPYGIDGGIEVLGGAPGSWAQAKSVALTGDFTLEYKVTLTASHFLLGYSKYDVPLGSDLTPERCAYFSPISYTWVDADDAQADPWVDAMNIGQSSPLANTALNQLYTVKFERVGGLITATMYNGTSSATFTVESAYTGVVYPHIALWSGAGTKLEFGKVTGVQNNTIDWDFVGNPNYSLNGQNQIISSYTFIDSGVEKILFSKNQYAIPTNGLEFKIKADNGFLGTYAEYIGASNTGPTVFGGFVDFGAGNFGVQNTFPDSYTYPSTPEIEWKIIIKPTETLFYVNNSLVGSKVNIVNSQVIYLNLRFTSSHNVKEYSLTAL